MISDKTWISLDISKFLIDSFPAGEQILTQMNGANPRLYRPGLMSENFL